MADPSFEAALATVGGSGAADHLPVPPETWLAAAVRSAAMQMGVAKLAVNRIQWVASSVCVPLCPVVYYLLVRMVDARWQAGDAVHQAIVTLAVAVAMTVVFSLVGVRHGIRLHLALFAFPVLPAVIVLVMLDSYPNIAVELAVDILIGLPGTYLGFGPALALAVGTALWMRRSVDPRARIVVRLLRLLDQITTRSGVLLTLPTRQELMAHIEGVSRIAERDLPRSLRPEFTDRGTERWLTTSCGLIAENLRADKRVLLLPGSSPRQDLVSLLAVQFLRACLDDWRQLLSDPAQPPQPPRRGRIRRVLPYVATAALLAGAALAAPGLFHRALADDTAKLQVVLLISAITSLVPLPSRSLGQMVDVLRDVVG